MEVAGISRPEEYQYIPHERRRFLEKVDRRLAFGYDVFMALFIRVIYLIEGCFFIYYLTADSGSYAYLTLTLGVLAIFADLLVVLIKRRGKEHLWFSSSSAFYTIIALVVIWYIVFKKYELDDLECSKNNTEILKQNFWIYIFARAMFPMNQKFRKEALFNMVISFLTNGTDIADFFSYVDEERISANKNLIIVILVFFTISTIQFSFTLSATVEKSEEETSFGRRLFELWFGTELWSFLLIFVTQDFPFLFIRCYVITHYGVEKNYLLYFLVVKNFFLCILEIYLMANFLLEFRHKHNSKKKANKQITHVSSFCEKINFQS